MKKTAIYMRVSTDRQAKDGDSIPAQRDALHKYIDEHKDLVFVGEYLDDGISGTKLDRDELQRLLDDVKAGKIDLILVTKLDRWFRSIRHYINTQELLDKYNCNWLAIWEPIYDSSTPQGRLIINQMMSIAQFEAENTGQRIRQVFSYKRSQGEVTSGKTPYGYSIKDKRLVPDENAANAAAIFEYFAKTGSIAKTTRYAVSLGRSITQRTLKGSMLSNPIYIGTRGDNPKFCQAIITLDLWERVQHGLAHGIRNNAKRVYLFTGLIICAECGRRMAAQSRTQNGRNQTMYRCQMKYQRAIPKCTNTKVIFEKTLERLLLDRIPSMIEEKQREVKKEAERRPDPAKKIAALSRKIDRLKDLYLAEEIDLEEYKTDKAKYQAEIADIERQVPQKDYDKILTLFTADLSDRYATWTPEARRAFWRGIIKEIRFDKDRNLTVEFL